MDITSYVSNLRENGLSAGTYTTYRTSLSRQLHSTRKRVSMLGPRKGYADKLGEVLPQDIGSNPE